MQATEIVLPGIGEPESLTVRTRELAIPGPLARLTWWNLLPNGRKATLFNLWAGKARHPKRFRAELRHDLGQVFGLLASGAISAQVARTFPLAEAARALRYAESGGVAGKVVLLPEPATVTG